MRKQSFGPSVAILAAALLCMVVALPAAAAENVRGRGIAMAKDMDANTLEIDGKAYTVVGGTTFKDLEGNVSSFEALEIFDVSKGLFTLEQATVVEYVARQSEGQWFLVSVRRVTELPR